MNKPTHHKDTTPTNQRESVASMHRVARFFDHFGLVRALIDVSFDVRRGEVFGLLGPKGSGKSTTLRILAGRLRPSEGKVKVFARSPRSRRARARIGYLLEPGSHRRPMDSPGLLAFLRELLGSSARRPSREVSESSLAAQRQASLMQVLLKGPDLLLLDEPFFFLEPASCRQFKDLILALARRGKTVVLSSDTLSDAKDVCTRMAVYFAGRIQAVGTLEELLADPEAVRFMAPLLPRQTTERILNIIREGLSAGSPAAELPQMLESRPPDGTRKPPNAKEGGPADAAEKVLAPLLKPAAPAKPLRSAGTTAETRSDERLRELAKPSPKRQPSPEDAKSS